MKNDDIGFFFVLFGAVGLWIIVRPAGAIALARLAHPNLRERDPKTTSVVEIHWCLVRLHGSAIPRGFCYEPNLICASHRSPASMHQSDVSDPEPKGSGERSRTC
jgi:hypothetical protein